MLILISTKNSFLLYYYFFFFTPLFAVTYLHAMLSKQHSGISTQVSVEESTKPSALVAAGIMIHLRFEAENCLGGQVAHRNKVCDISKIGVGICYLWLCKDVAKGVRNEE